MKAELRWNLANYESRLSAGWKTHPFLHGISQVTNLWKRTLKLCKIYEQLQVKPRLQFAVLWPNLHHSKGMRAALLSSFIAIFCISLIISSASRFNTLKQCILIWCIRGNGMNAFQNNLLSEYLVLLLRKYFSKDDEGRIYLRLRHDDHFFTWFELRLTFCSVAQENFQQRT